MSTKVKINVSLIGALCQDRVKRWHVVDVSREQRLSEHSAGVTFIVDHIFAAMEVYFRPISPKVYLAALQAALYHDAHEPFVGDRPTCAKEWDKNAVKYTSSLYETAMESVIDIKSKRLITEVISLADSLEALRFLIRNSQFQHSKIIRNEIDERVSDKITEVLMAILEYFGMTSPSDEQITAWEEMVTRLKQWHAQIDEDK